MPNQVTRLRNRAAEAEGRADAQAEQIERQKKELEELKRKLAARPSSSVSTPPGRGTPANRRSAARPAASPGRGSSAASQAGTIAEEEEKDEEADGDVNSDEGDDDSSSSSDGDGDRDRDGAARSDGEEPGDESGDEHDMHIMRQLLEDFRANRLDPNDRAALMSASGDQFSQLITQHWKEKSTPPEWLVSLFRPPASGTTPTSAARITQVNSRSTASSGTVEQEVSRNGGSASPSLIFRRPAPSAARTRSPPRPRHLSTEFTTTPRTVDTNRRPSNPVAPSTLPQPNSMPVGTTSTYTKFQFRQNDIPKEIVFSGKPGETDVVEILTRYKARVKLASVAQDNPPDHIVDQRAIQFLPFVLRDAASDSLVQLVDGTLEWRSENRLMALREAGQCVKPRAPATWEEYCHAFTFLFSAPNRISVLAREIATIKQSEDQTVDTYSLKVTQARTRLLAEAARSAPAHLSPHEHAWDVSMTATFENGLLPGIRLESIREDPPNTFQEARIRAKKHEANNLRGACSTTPSTVSAVAYPDPPQLENTVSSNTAVIKDLRAELSKLKSAVQQPGARSTQGTSVNKRARTSGKATGPSTSTTATKQKQEQESCPYPGCKYKHSIEKCALRQRHLDQGFERKAV